MSSVLNIYEEFNNSLAQVAEQEPTTATELQASPGTVGVFEEVAVLSLLKTIEGHDRLQRFHPDKSYGVMHGMEVAARFNYLATVCAAHNGLVEPDEVESVLRHPDSVGELLKIAETHGDVAKEVEYEHGLTRSSASPGYIKDGTYVLKDGRIHVTTLQGSIMRHTFNHINSERFNPEAKQGCHAHLADMLVPIYGHLTTIALKNPHLVAATIDATKNSEAQEVRKMSMVEYIEEVFPKQ